MAVYDKISRLLDSYEPRLRDEFLRAVRDLADTAAVARVAELLERGAIQEAAALVVPHESVGTFAPIAFVAEDGYRQAGVAMAEDIPQRGRVFRFDATTRSARDWTESIVSRLAGGLSAQTRIGVAEALGAGLAAGRRPRLVALDVVGRVVRSSGRREGGLVGLTSQQATFVRNARTELQSEDPSAFLRRTLRDRRFDGLIRRTMRGGERLNSSQVEMIVGRYADAMLRLRGETLAVTEMGEATEAAQAEALRQAAAGGWIDPSRTRKTWDTRRDTRVRDTHRAMEGVSVGADELFVLPSGATMRYPRDSKYGAPSDERAGCRCRARYRVYAPRVPA